MTKEKNKQGHNPPPFPEVPTPNPPLITKRKEGFIINDLEVEQENMYDQAIAMLFKELIFLQHDIRILKSDVKGLKNAKNNK
jgi:hypothetical protein